MRPHLSYANVVATIALFCALGGGAYAASQLPRDSVGTAQLKTNAVTAAKVKDRSLLGRDFKPGQLPSGPRGPQGERGPEGPRGAEGPRGPSTAYSDFGIAQLPLGPSGTLVAQLSLPAGSYVLTGRANIFNNGVAATGDCSIWAGIGQLDEALFELQAASGINEIPVTVHAAVTLSMPVSVQLICEGLNVAGVDMYAAERKLTAIQVGSIDQQ